jgi:hypothetical protein
MAITFSPQSARASRARGAGVTAVLGPTNTGKTHLAIERMLGHKAGIIGLPLRLLAREVYTKVVERIGAEHQGLLAAAAVQHAVGEDVAAVQIRAELDLVDSDEGQVEIAGHRLDGGDPEARVRRLDLLLAGDQRDILSPDPIDHLVVDFAGEQPQRQPDHARRVGEHPLDGEEGLAGVGGAENGGNAGAPQTVVAVHRRRERNWHPISRLNGPVSASGHEVLYHNATPGGGAW